VRMFVHDTQYYLPNDGKLTYTMQEDNNGIELKWGHLYWSDVIGKVHYGDQTNYTVIATKDPRARIDTQCALRKEIASKFVMASFQTDNVNKFSFKTPISGERYYVNVIAKVHAPGEDEAELIPYVPVEVFVGSRTYLSKFVLCKFSMPFMSYYCI